ncbi:hypothetical protein KI387_039623, partial [Taxus chinensis]
MALQSPHRFSVRRHLLQGHRTIARQNSDRFIAHRGSMDFDLARYLLRGKDKENTACNTAFKQEYRKELAACLLEESNIGSKKSRILTFRERARSAPDSFQELFSDTPSKLSKPRLYIPQSEEEILHAPGLVDDFYLNLLDWSISNVLCVALRNTAYLWDATQSTTSELMTVDDDVGPITSVSWAPDGRHAAIGLNNSVVQLWDSSTNKLIRFLRGHSARVGSLSWNAHILSTGGLDGFINNHDIRMRESIVQTFRGHEQEVCGLKWSLSGQQLASGGNDNLLHIWDKSMSSSNGVTFYLHRLDEHRAAVKALAWCPFQSNLSASGGGSADRCIKFWNTQKGACLNTINTNSQVSSLLWNKHERELLSSHGFSKNQLTLWKYPSMVKIAELTGHTSRVLHLAESPDGYTVASAAAAGDQTIRFWQVFGTPETKSKEPVGAFNNY